MNNHKSSKRIGLSKVHVESGYKSAFLIVICVPMGSVIVAFPYPTILASHPTIVKIFPILFVRVWKYLVSLSIEFMVRLSIRHISSYIGLTSKIYMKINIISVSYSHTYEYTYCIIIDTKL
jgi:hypothetical protein